MSTYNYNDRKQLSQHFKVQEFKCKCGKAHDIIIDNTLVDRLERLYKIADCSRIIITSGYRCPTHSRNVGGSASDAHTVGIAADIMCYDKQGKLKNPWLVAACAEQAGFSGIGVMSKALHIDVRNSSNYKNSHWFGDETTGNNNIKTFIKPSTQSSDAVKNLQTILNNKGNKLTVDGIIGKNTLNVLHAYTINRGDKGELTKWVQEKLNNLGYSCGTADGIAGNNTMNAIHEFQKSNGLGVGYLGGTDWDMLTK